MFNSEILWEDEWGTVESTDLLIVPGELYALSADKKYS